jgi:hypothetical protein
MYMDREGIHPGFFGDFEESPRDKPACQMYQHIDSSKLLNDSIDAVAAGLRVGNIELHEPNIGRLFLHNPLEDTSTFSGPLLGGNHNLCAFSCKFPYRCSTYAASAACN